MLILKKAKVLEIFTPVWADLLFYLHTCEAQYFCQAGQGSNEARWSKLYTHTGYPVELAKPPAAYRVGHQNGLSVPIVYSKAHT